MFVTVILSIDNTFRHSIRDFSRSEFFSYHVPEGTIFVFTNITRIILFVSFFTVALVCATKIVSYTVTSLRDTRNRKHSDEKMSEGLTEEKEDIQKATNKLTIVPYITAALTMPSILLFYLYNTNRVQNHLVFAHILILAGLLGVAGLLIFFIFKSGTDSMEGSLLLSIVFWLFFWLFEATYSMVGRIASTLTPIGFMVMLALILLFMSAAIRRLNTKLAKLSTVFMALAVCLPALLIFNLLPGVTHEVELTRARAAVSDEESPPFYIRSNFVIDDTLPTPDIYWIFTDGMMSLEAIERFWGESQDRFREEFALRGFVINPDAKLNAGFTAAAAPSLFSPAFYDSFLGERLALVETELSAKRLSSFVDGLTQVGLTLNDDILPNYELPIALISRDYEVDLRSTAAILPVMPRSIEALSHGNTTGNASWLTTLMENSGNLTELLNKTTPLSIISVEERANRTRADVGQKHSSRPRFVFLWHNVKASYIRREERSQLNGLRFALNYADEVLANNPNAVIVIQSDHGPIHMPVTQQEMLNQGYSVEQVLDQLHSVFSAVRIPEKYGGLDEPIAPLNISRELVNRFVGQNYDLLP
jgi:hypothetical protein